MLIMPVSLAPRLSTQPPQPRMAPERHCTRRDGSWVLTAFICMAQGMLHIWGRPWSGIWLLTVVLSVAAEAASKLSRTRTELDRLWHNSRGSWNVRRGLG